MGLFGYIKKDDLAREISENLSDIARELSGNLSDILGDNVSLLLTETIFNETQSLEQLRVNSEQLSIHSKKLDDILAYLEKMSKAQDGMKEMLVSSIQDASVFLKEIRSLLDDIEIANSGCQERLDEFAKRLSKLEKKPKPKPRKAKK